jgi:thiazole-adenylate synthase
MELKIGRAIIKHGMEDLYEYSEVDVAIVGAGPAGLTAASTLPRGGIKLWCMSGGFPSAAASGQGAT